MYKELSNQWAAYLANDGSWLPTEWETKNLDDSYEAVRMYWIERLSIKETELLASVELPLLAINPSEASVERSFSQQKLIHSSLRNRLGNDIIEAQMFIKMNDKLLTGGNLTWYKNIHYDWVELDEEGAVEGVESDIDE